MNNVCPKCMSWLLDHQDLIGWKRCGSCRYSKKTEKSMITLQEINNHNYKTTPEQDENLLVLLEKINKVRTAYGIPMIVSSGLRSEEDQQRINPKASKSHHLTGEAIDIQDIDGKLKIWVKDNVKLMEEIGLWFEDFDHTPTWVHAQIVPPHSGNRFFIP